MTGGQYAVRLKNVRPGPRRSSRRTGLHLCGHLPNTGLFEGASRWTRRATWSRTSRQHTNVEGVFAAGDVQDHVYRQAITAAGTGGRGHRGSDSWRRCG